MRFYVQVVTTKGHREFMIELAPDEYIKSMSLRMQDGTPLVVYPFTLTDDGLYVRAWPPSLFTSFIEPKD